MLSIENQDESETVLAARDGERNGSTSEGCDGLSNEQNQQVLGNTMKVTYDSDVDVLRILFSSAPIEESDEDKPGVILDYDKEGNVVGLEVLNASQRIENPRAVEYASV
jgi:uncharacterized protein YuzE